ncbi:hypothetical protein FDUTEX481_04884 [Tolypothrix sp. PCC 7601]|nr:hypothetical protein FDUTEX481_04884 [Tolypothrix sp. PCC 7601]
MYSGYFFDFNCIISFLCYCSLLTVDGSQLTVNSQRLERNNLFF